VDPSEGAGRRDEASGGSTRERLMAAALAYLATHGVLGGLNLREIAEQVGVTPANIYHYFGSRRGLLRAALTRATEQLAPPLAKMEGLSFDQRRLRMFDEITQRPDLRLGALLALDADPDFAPLPFLKTTAAQYQAQREAGRLPADLDVIAAHLLTLAASIGVAIYRDAAARQLGVDPELLTARTRAALEQWLAAAAKPPPAT
jgi:AcrR family transcriptional regulator